MKYYDAHLHFFYQGSLNEFKEKVDYLEKIGFASVNILVIAEFPMEMDTYLKMIPGDYHPYVTQEAIENQKDPFPVVQLSHSVEIVPFLDARFLEKNIEEKIKIFKERGFKGVKLLYVPEEDPFLRIGGMEKTFGRTCKESEEITTLIIEQASFYHMPILMHVDLRKYGDFVSEVLASYPKTHFNLPHFGFSRKAISSFLDKFENCYTDMASLESFMEREPSSYKNFIQQYQDRVLFGSDAVIGHPERVQSALHFINRFIENREIFHKLVHENYKRFMSYL